MSEEANNKGGRYLLILSCSKRKKPISKAPALELYDGPFYRVLRKNMPPNLDVLILSAKYGLIKSDEKISGYDQIMTTERANELADDVFFKLKKELEINHYDSITINLGKTYALALEKCKEMLDKYNVRWINGQIGERLHQFKNWLAEINTGGGL